MFGNVNVDYKPCKTPKQLRRAADYILGRQAEQKRSGVVKTAPDLYWGIHCDRDHFARDVLMTRNLFGKKPNRKSNLAYKISISFSPEDNAKLTYQEVFRIAKEFAERFFKGFEVLFAVHTDKPHKHVHFLIGNCNIHTGKAFRRNERDLYEMSEFFGEQCMKRGLTHSVRQDFYQKHFEQVHDKETFAEHQMKASGKETFKDELREVIRNEISDPNNCTLQDVVSALRLHYHVECRVKGNTISYRHPNFTDKSGKPASVRGSKLGEQYTVKGIEYELTKIRRSKENTEQPAQPRIYITGETAGTAPAAGTGATQCDDTGHRGESRSDRRGSQAGRARMPAGSSDAANVPDLAGLYGDYQRRNAGDRRTRDEEPEHPEPVRPEHPVFRR